MLSPQLINLTTHTQKCFADQSEHVLNLMGVVADIWTVLDLLPKHNIHISAKSDYTAPQKLLLTVGRTDFRWASLGTVVQKEYDVTHRQTYLNVEISELKMNDAYVAPGTPPKLFSQILNAEPLPPERLAAILIEDIKRFMSPENQIRIGNCLDKYASDLPIVTAMKATFPATWQPFDGHSQNVKIAPQSAADGPQ